MVVFFICSMRKYLSKTILFIEFVEFYNDNFFIYLKNMNFTCTILKINYNVVLSIFGRAVNKIEKYLRIENFLKSIL